MYTGDKENEEIVWDNDHPSAKTKGLKQAIAELKRILKPGGILYISFPFGKYADYQVFQQFDLELIDVLINSFEPSKSKETIFRYDPSGWILSDRDGCKECEYFNVHTSKYFDPNSTIEFPSDYTAGVRAVACLELKK
jgi:DNA modification methylase